MTTTAFMTDTLIRSTLILACAAIVTWVLRRRGSAAQRHMAWLLAVAAVGLLPLASACLPRWEALPYWATVQPVAITAPAAVVVESPREFALDTPAPAVAPITRTAPLHETPPMGRHALIAAALLAGTVLCVLRLFIAAIALRRLRRSATVDADSPARRMLDEVAVPLHITRPIALLRAAGADMPMTFGLIHPSILLPADAETWSAARLRMVLLHEIAHIKRRDVITHTIARLIAAVYWFHPLMWLAMRQLSAERERACDDMVLAQTPDASDYADELLQIASNRRAGLAAAAAIAMAKPSRLEGRLLGILDARRNRRTVTRAAVIAAALLLTAIVVPLAILQAAEPQTITLEQRAQELVENLRNGNVKAVRRQFDARMLEAISEGQLGDIWPTLEKVSGPFQSFGEAFRTQEYGFDVVLIPTKWQHNELDFRVVFDHEGKVSGLWTTTPRKVDSAENHSTKGWRLWQQQRYGEAEKAFAQAVKVDPSDINGWNGLGWCQFNLGKTREAIASFTKVIETMPVHPAGLNGLGQAHLALGEYDKAEPFLLKAAENRANAAWWGLARLYLATNQPDKARPWAQKILAETPDNAEAQQLLAQANGAAPPAVSWPLASLRVTFKSLELPQPLPYLLQVDVNDIQPGGAIFFAGAMAYANDAAKPVTEQRFSNSDFVEVRQMYDGDNNALQFEQTHSERKYQYNVSLREAIAQGSLVELHWTGMKSTLIKPVHDKPGTYTYRMNHYPGGSVDVRRIEVHRLPRGAAVIDMSKNVTSRVDADGRTIIELDVMVKESVEVWFTYRLADEGQSP